MQRRQTGFNEVGGVATKGEVPAHFRDRIKEFRRIPTSDLVSHPQNWRRHGSGQRAALKGLLKELGIVDAVIVRKLPDGRFQLIDGHLRAEIIKDDWVPALVIDATEAEAEKILLTLDPLGAMAQADAERARELLASVSTDDAGVAELLAHIVEEHDLDHGLDLQDPEPQLDRAAELQEKWRTEIGQLWSIGPHRLICGDSRNKLLVERLVGNGKVRMVWTDAPYGVNLAAKNEFLNRSDRGGRVQKPIANDDLPPDEIKTLFASALKSISPFAVPGAACYATVPSGALLPCFIAGFQASGFSFKHLLVWVKQQFVIGMCDYHYRHEAILYGWLENGPHYFVKRRDRDSVFEFDKPHASELHSTTKPVDLVAAMIANSSRRGEIVYDPFLGSGTTLAAAHQLGRRGFGVEIDPGYAAVTLERMSRFGLQPQLKEAEQ
jgi:DNA modification methylase